MRGVFRPSARTWVRFRVSALATFLVLPLVLVSGAASSVQVARSHGALGMRGGLQGVGVTGDAEPRRNVDPNWWPRVTLQQDSGYLLGPDVAVSPRGAISVVWQTDDAIVVRRKLPGRTWGPIRRISSGRGSGVRVAADGQGRLTVVWVYENRVLSSRRTVHGTWTKPVVLSSALPGPSIDHLKLEVNTRGDAVAVWDWNYWYFEDEGGPVGRIQASYRPAHGGWEQYKDIKRGAYGADAMIGPKGVATIAWPGARRGIQAIRHRSGAWTRRTMVMAHEPRAEYVDLARPNARTGNPVLTWLAPRRGGRLVLRGSRLANGRWTKAASITKSVPYWAFNGVSPTAGFDRSGAGTVVWTQGPYVKVARTRGAAGFDTPYSLTRTGGAPDSLAIAINERGDTVVGWVGDFNAHAAFRPAGRRWLRPLRLSPRNVIYFSDVTALAVAIDRRGRAVAVWNADNDSYRGAVDETRYIELRRRLLATAP